MPNPDHDDPAAATGRPRLIVAISAWAGLLHEPGLRGLWLAQSVSPLGTQVTVPAMPLLAIWPLGATTLQVGILTAVDFVPFLLFTLPAGVWVDRWPKRRILIAADIGRAFVLAAIPAAYLAGILEMWQLYVVGFLAGTLTVFF